MDICK